MIRRILLSMSVCMAAMSAVSFAQPAPDGAQTAQPAQPATPGTDGGGRRGGGNGGGPGGGFNREEMINRIMDGMKDRMKVPDDEWAVIRPKLEKVMAAQRETRVGGMGGFMGGGFGGGGGGGGGGGFRNRDGGSGGNGPGGGGGNNENPSEVQKASRDLNTTLQNESASADEINTKLKALREARTKAEESLKAAREDLKGVLNERQEAFLVMAGMLE